MKRRSGIDVYTYAGYIHAVVRRENRLQIRGLVILTPLFRQLHVFK